MPESINRDSSWTLPATPKQSRAIAHLTAELGYQEPRTSLNRMEARNMIRGFIEERKRRQADSKRGSSEARKHYE